MTESRKNVMSRAELLSITLGLVLIGFLYTRLPCYSFFSDGIQFAIELRYSSDWILHPHHVLHPLLPQMLYRLIGGGNSGIGELDILIAWSQFMGIIACLGIVLALRAGFMKIPTILSGLAFFAFSNGIWYFAVTPNQNSTPLFFHVFTLLAILYIAGKQQNKPSTVEIITVSVLTALSILASQANAALILPAALVILRGNFPRKEKFGLLILNLWLTVIILACLVALIGFLLGGFRSFTDFINWQHSYVYQQRWWVESFPDALHRNLTGLLTVHIAEPFTQNLPLKIPQVIVIIFFLVEIICAIIAWVRGKTLQPIQTIGLLAALPILFFSFFYIPENLNLRILYIPGFILFLMPSIESRYLNEKVPTIKVFIVILVIASLFLVNLTAKYIPASNPVSNSNLVETAQLLDSVDPIDMIIYPWTDEGHTLSLYAQYFLGCDALTVNKLIDISEAIPDDAFHEFLIETGPDRFIWIHEDVLNPEAGMDSMNIKYKTGLNRSEIADFIERWFESSGEYITIDGKNYLAYSIIL